MSRINLLLIVCIATIVSCKQPEKPLTKEEVMDFAKKVEISIEKRDGSFLDKAIDEKSMMKKMDLNDKSVAEELKNNMKFGTRMVESVSKKGTYTLVKHYEKDHVHHLLFRLFADKQLNYHDYEMIRVNGHPMIADIYVYVTGENISETMKTLWAQINDNAARVSDNELLTSVKKLPQIRSLINQGRYTDASDMYNELPQTVKNTRTFQIIHVNICSKLTEDEYTRALDEYQAIYPNEPNMQLLLIDANVMKKQYSKALDAVNELDRMIDKDPLLDYYRAMCYTLMKNDAKRSEYLEKVVKNMPDLEEGLLELIVDYLQANQLEKARPLIVHYKSKMDFEQSSLDLLLLQYPAYNEKYGSH